MRLVRTSDIPTGEVDWAEVPYAAKKPNSVGHYLEDGDIVVARTGAGSVGNVAIVRKPPRAVAASYLIRIRVTTDIKAEYLLWFLRTPAGQEQLAQRAVGSVVPNLSSQRLATVVIPLPTPAEQQMIADRIVRAKGYLDLSSSALNRARRLLARAPSSMWRDLVDASQARGEAWVTKELDDIVSVHDRKRVPLNRNERARRPGGTPYFGASGIIDYIDGHTHEGNFLLLSEDGQNLESRRQSIAFQATGRFWANNHVHVLGVIDSVNTAFLAQALNESDLQAFLTGSTQPKLPLNRLRGINVALPDREFQDTIMKSFATTASLIAQAKAAVDSADDKLASGWTAFLAHCFSSSPVTPTAPPQVTEVARNSMNNRRAPGRNTFKSVLAALDQYPQGLTPEELFSSLDRPRSSVDQDVDAFYFELRRLVEYKDVEEVRTDGASLIRRIK